MGGSWWRKARLEHLVHEQRPSALCQVLFEAVAHRKDGGWRTTGGCRAMQPEKGKRAGGSTDCEDGSVVGAKHGFCCWCVACQSLGA